MIRAPPERWALGQVGALGLEVEDSRFAEPTVTFVQLLYLALDHPDGLVLRELAIQPAYERERVPHVFEDRRDVAAVDPSRCRTHCFACLAIEVCPGERKPIIHVGPQLHSLSRSKPPAQSSIQEREFPSDQLLVWFLVHDVHLSSVDVTSFSGMRRVPRAGSRAMWILENCAEVRPKFKELAAIDLASNDVPHRARRR